MVRENSVRNSVIYDLWVKGLTIDDISFETGIPRSTVGYYVRKFNKKAKKGEEIIIPYLEEQVNPQDMAIQAFIKSWFLSQLTEIWKTGDIDRVYKLLMICKLMKELQRDLFPTREECEAFFDNLGYVIKQYVIANKLVS